MEIQKKTRRHTEPDTQDDRHTLSVGLSVRPTVGHAFAIIRGFIHGFRSK